MDSKDNIILVGGGGHCKSIIDVVESTELYNIVGIIDIAEKIGSKVLGYDIIGTDDSIKKLCKMAHFFLITLGQIKSGELRKKIYNEIIRSGGVLPVVISPYSTVSRHATIGEGTVIMHHCLVNAFSSVGKNCIINSGAMVEHDVIVEDDCHISTGVILNGNVRVNSGSFIGSGSIVNNGVVIGHNNIIASGSLVNRNTEPHKTYAGIPAKILIK